MKVQTETAQGILLVRLTGDDSLDGTNSPQVKAAIVPLCTTEIDLIVDLTGIRFVDSAGVGALVSLLKAVRRSGRRMALTGVQPPVLSILEIIRLTVIFEITADVAEARETLRAVTA